jgi:hypothetical protein
MTIALVKNRLSSHFNTPTLFKENTIAERTYVYYFLVKGNSINGIIMTNTHPADSQITPPVVLVQTWCLLCRDKDEEISQHAIKMLLDAFGDMRTVVEFVKDNNIRVG